MKRNFNEWFDTFTDTIANYKCYVDFEKVYKNANEFKIELNILNSLVGSRNIENEFKELLQKYPNVLKAIPVILAVREAEIIAIDEKGKRLYNFDNMNYDVLDYCYFMRETGLFDLISNKIINNIYDYVLGIEVGLDSNARKNRIGDVMEEIVERYIVSAKFEKDISYFKEIKSSTMSKLWSIDLGAISNKGKALKKFDYVIKTNNCIYGIECNFYSSPSGGSKLNETARSYKEIALETKKIKGFEFVWITDGRGWKNARNNLEETFDVLENLYNINDLNSGIINKVIK